MGKPRVVRWGNPPPGVHNVPVYLGLERGIFCTPEGHIEAMDNLTGADYTEALVAGQFDMGYIGAPPLFAALVRTDSYRVIGQGAVRHPSVYLIAAPHISSIRALVGKSIALNNLGTASQSILRTILRTQGISETDVKLRIFVEASRIIDAIANGEVAAAMIWEPYMSYAERVFRWRLLADSRTVISPSRYCYCLYARRELIEEDPRTVLHIMKGYSDCVKYAVEHLDEAAQVVYARIPNIPLEDIDRALRREAPNWTWDTSIDRNFLTTVVAELKEQSIVMASFSLNSVLASLPTS